MNLYLSLACPFVANFSFSWVPMEVLSSLVSPTLPMFFLMFVAIYLLGYFYIFGNWVGVSRLEASSCLISLTHGTPAVLLATSSILQTPFASSAFDFAAPNTAFQSMVLEYSIAYFLTDLFHYMLFIPGDVLFIAHHLATLYVFITCRYIVGHGALSLLALLLLAEVTSACQNTWSLSLLRRAHSPAAAALFRWLSPVFYSFYSVVRGGLGPLFVYKMGKFYSSGGAEGLIPKWAWISWMFVIVSAILVSILWVSTLWMDLYRERCKKEMRKSS